MLGFARTATLPAPSVSISATGKSRSDRLVRAYEEHGSGWFWETDESGCVTYLSSKVVDILTADGLTIAGSRLSEIFKLDEGAGEVARSLSFHLTARTGFANYTVRGARGLSDSWWSISGKPWFDAHGQFKGFVGTGSDLTQIRRTEAEITKLALFDSLTGLANRVSMRTSLNQMLSQHATHGRSTTLMIIDLDRFKAVNDTLGHQSGDDLLKQVATRLRRVVGERGLVGRLGGDEFEIILPNEYVPERVSQYAQAIIKTVSEPYSVNNSPVSIGCSIGIAIATDQHDDAETLVRNADLALYNAKGEGRGVHRFYDDKMLAIAKSRKSLEDDLRRALGDGQLHLKYQQLVSTRHNNIVGYEALMRWVHPERGDVSPSEFIPIAEECGLIEALGEWALQQACCDAVLWPETMRVAVNVSPIQFASAHLPMIVTRALAASGLSASRLELEITEGVFLNDDVWSEKMFRSLKSVGVRLALDDFGTGYSSLGYLKNAPFDKIKIDQSFVRGAIVSGSRNAAIIKAIVMLADTLGMETTAEGVEQCDEIGLIAGLGCSHIQGFVYGRPARLADVIAYHLAHGDTPTTSGPRVTRLPRTKMLRRARIAVGNLVSHGRIRDMSRSGAMIEGISAEAGVDILLEVLENQVIRGKVKWASDDRAGIEFDEQFDLETLKT